MTIIAVSNDLGVALTQRYHAAFRRREFVATHVHYAEEYPRVAVEIKRAGHPWSVARGVDARGIALQAVVSGREVCAVSRSLLNEYGIGFNVAFTRGER